MIRREIQASGRRTDDVIEKHRRNRTDNGMQPKDFARALKLEVPNLKDQLSNAKLTLLVHYLVREEFGIVSFEKLHRALNQSDQDPPLRQDKLDEIKAQVGKVLRQLGAADIAIEVIHLLHFLRESQLSVHEMFKVTGQRQLTPDVTITEQFFDQCCQERGYVPKDRARLVQALTRRDGHRSAGVSLYELAMAKRKDDAKRDAAARPGEVTDYVAKMARFD